MQLPLSRKPRPKHLPWHFSEVLKQGFTWAVIDRSHPDGSITLTKWKLLGHALFNVFLEVKEYNPGHSPSCRDAVWYQGHIKLVACSDLRSKELYKAAIRKIDQVWLGARIATVPPDQAPNRLSSKEYRLDHLTRKPYLGCSFFSTLLRQQEVQF